MAAEYVEFKRPSKFEYLKRCLLCLVSIKFYKFIVSSLAYVMVNYVWGRTIIKIGRNTKLHPSVLLREAERISIGDNCLINHNNVLQAGRKNAVIKIGNFVHTGPHVMFYAYNHRFDDPSVPSIQQGYVEQDIIVEDDVWIGAGSIILCGVTIGRGAVIAAGTIVNTDIPPMSICAGNPVRVVKDR